MDKKLNDIHKKFIAGIINQIVQYKTLLHMQ